MQKKLVSVIIPTYNRGYIIDKALISLRNQTFFDFEVIVVDDGSMDNTEDVVKCFDDLKLVYIKLEENRGANHARNVGISRAQGDYLAFLDSDNEWMPLNLATKVEMLQGTSDKVGFVFGSFYVVKGAKEEIYLPTGIETQDSLKRRMLKINVVDTNTVLVKRECFQKVGYFDEELKRLQDWDMFGRILFDGKYEAVFCKEPLVINKIQKDSISMKQEIYFESRDRMLRKRWNDYKKEYEVDGIMDEYLFALKVNGGTSFYDRLQLLQAFDIDKEEWDRFWNKKMAQIERMKVSERNLSVFKKWVLLEEKNVGINEWFVKHNIARIGIYGLGYLGKHLLHELELADRRVTFIIDKNEKICHKDIPVFHTIENLPDVEMIVVAAVAYFEEVERELMENTTAIIVSLEEILCDLLNKENE